MAGLVDLGTAPRLVPVDVDDGDPKAITAVVDDLRAALGGALLGWNDWADTRGDMLVETDFFGAFLGGFGVFVMMSCAVVVASAIGARTVARRRMIGLYKAVGYTARQLGAAIVLEHLAIALLACAAGNLLASVLAPTFRVGSLRVFETSRVAWNGRAFLTSTVAVCAIVVVATVVPAVRAGRIEVADALSGANGRRRRATVAFTVGVGAHSASGDGVAGADQPARPPAANRPQRDGGDDRSRRRDRVHGNRPLRGSGARRSGARRRPRRRLRELGHGERRRSGRGHLGQAASGRRLVHGRRRQGGRGRDRRARPRDRRRSGSERVRDRWRPRPATAG